MTGGQFFQWRFLQRGMWWQAHPYSLSAAPAGNLSLLQELPEQCEVTVLLRASTSDQLVLRDEVAAELRRRGGRLIERVGSRRDVPLDAAALSTLVPDVARRQVYLCGPDALTHQLATDLATAGVREDRIHYESFTF